MNNFSLFQFGAEKLSLAVHEDNFGAQKLYESEGFVEEGRLDKEIKFGQRYADLILMRKHLQ